MKANQATFPVRVMSRLLGVSASGFYAWVNRSASARAVEDIGLTALIHAIHRRSGGAYGAPSIQAELADDHQRRVGTKRVARLMRAAGLQGLQLRRFVTTTVGDPAADRAVDQVDRQFTADGPDRLWVADITYVPTWAGFLYLAIVLDVWSRRIVGWAMEPHLKTELVLSALNMALAQRRPEAVIHHSDRGCQYTSYAFGKRCREAGVMPSMGSTGDAYDNAMAESFFATLEARSVEPAPVSEPGRGADGHLPVARGMVQSASAPLGSRLPVTHQLREETAAAERLRPKSVPVHGTGASPQGGDLRRRIGRKADRRHRHRNARSSLERTRGKGRDPWCPQSRFLQALRIHQRRGRNPTRHPRSAHCGIH